MSHVNLRKTFDALCPRSVRPYWDRLQGSDVGYRLARGAFWSLLAVAISRGLALAATIPLAWMLGPERYGELGILRSTVEMLGVFAGFGLGLTATKHVAEFRNSDPARAGRVVDLALLTALGTAGLMSIGLFWFAPALAAHTLNAAHLGGLLRVGCLILILSTVNGVQTGALAGFEAFKTMARVSVLSGLLSVPMLLGGCYLGGVEGTVWALVANLALTSGLSHRALRREAARAGVTLHSWKCLGEWGLLWRFSLPAAMGSALVGPVHWACGAILVNQPDGYVQMGIFNAANQWRLAILFIPGALGLIALPMLSHLSAENDLARYRSTLKYSAWVNGGAALAVAVPVALLSPWIMAAYGPAFAGSAVVLVWLALCSLLIALCTVAAQAIVSKGRMWLGFLLNAIWAGSALTLTWCYAHTGARGLAFSLFASYCIHALSVSLCAKWVMREPDRSCGVSHASRSVHKPSRSCVAEAVLAEVEP